MRAMLEGHSVEVHAPRALPGFAGWSSKVGVCIPQSPRKRGEHYKRISGTRKFRETSNALNGLRKARRSEDIYSKLRKDVAFLTHADRFARGHSDATEWELPGSNRYSRLDRLASRRMSGALLAIRAGKNACAGGALRCGAHLFRGNPRWGDV